MRTAIRKHAHAKHHPIKRHTPILAKLNRRVSSLYTHSIDNAKEKPVLTLSLAGALTVLSGLWIWYQMKHKP